MFKFCITSKAPVPPRTSCPVTIRDDGDLRSSRAPETERRRARVRREGLEKTADRPEFALPNLRLAMVSLLIGFLMWPIFRKRMNLHLDEINMRRSLSLSTHRCREQLRPLLFRLTMTTCIHLNENVLLAALRGAMSFNLILHVNHDRTQTYEYAVFPARHFTRTCVRTCDGRRSQEVHCRFEGHFLKRWSVGLEPEPVERLVFALEGHVVGDQSQVPVVHLNTVVREHVTNLLSVTKKTRHVHFVKIAIMLHDPLCVCFALCQTDIILISHAHPLPEANETWTDPFTQLRFLFVRVCGKMKRISVFVWFCGSFWEHVGCIV